MATSPVFIGSEISRADFLTLGVTDSALFIDMQQLVQTIDLTNLGKPEDASFCGIRMTDLACRRVWYHLGSFEDFEFQVVPNDSQAGFVRRQLHATLRFLEWWISEHSKCIDTPVNQRYWSNKLIQLSSLQSAFPSLVPITGMTSIYGKITLGRIIKHVSESSRVDEERWSYARILSADARVTLNAGDAFPVIHQTNVATETEYRTYVFGKNHITIQVLRTDGSDIDLHLDDAAIERATPIDTPLILSSKLAEIKNHINLNIFSVDWITLNGSVQVLEINVLSGWSWLPRLASDAVAAAARRYFFE